MKVFCAISGGVDSSVAAALLKRAGFDIVAVFMKLANLLSFTKNEQRARKIASVLKIPFLSFDFREEFKKKIIDYFLKEYEEGTTPNPCVVCNKEIKFGLLLEKALALGADYVATGHYARIKTQNSKLPEGVPLTTGPYGAGKTQNHNLKLKTYKLLKGKDKDKDQSYFLWQLNQSQLKHVLFPIGDYTKPEVRTLAKKFKLPVLNINESQEICFIQTTIDDFLKHHLKTKSGKIINPQEKVVGKHLGLHFYTIGQRKGIKLSGGPFYVLDKDPKRNILVVTQNEKNLYKKELLAKNINWISGKEPKLPLKIKAKIRYRHQAATAIISSRSECKVYSLNFKVAQRAITPGQSVVFYSGNQILGGGTIEKITKKCNIKD